MSIRIHIKSIPSSNNVYIGQGSKSKAIRDYQQEKKLWREWIWVMRQKLKSRGELMGYDLPLPEATIIIAYHFKTHVRRDPDNYSGKFILDALTHNKFIKDDSFKEIDLLPVADFGNKEDSVEIFIIRGKRLIGLAKDLIGGGKDEQKGKIET